MIESGTGPEGEPDTGSGTVPAMDAEQETGITTEAKHMDHEHTIEHEHIDSRDTIDQEPINSEDLTEQDDPSPESSIGLMDTAIDMEVLNHLLFHQAIGEGCINIDKYLDILKGITEGEHLTMMDSRDRTTALVFELVLNEDFNPWNIDLKRFSESYLKRLKGDLDFITAGRLIFMAYRILRLQSAELLESLSEPDEDDFDDFMQIEDWMEDDESYAYTRKVVEMKNPPIEEAILHRGDRRVTLFELVEAFSDAAVESEEMMEHNVRMRAERNRLAQLRRKNRTHVGDRVHDEDYREDIRKITAVLRELDVKTLTFSNLVQHSPIDTITTFIALLFLNFDEKITIEQKDFPYGELIITIPDGEESTVLAAAMETPSALATEA